MKRILITGKGSYIGNSIKKWLEKWPKDYIVHEVDMISDEWKKKDFSNYDCICHVAGIAHTKNVEQDLYEKVNHLLPIRVARKAQDSKVRQFIFLSSGAVYSQNDRKNKNIIVDEKTPFSPNTYYGISKLNAEKDLLELLKNSSMKLVILRPPIVYGYGARGNYNLLEKIVEKISVFPKIENKRSMIFIDNLCEFIRLVIEKNSEGIFLPQNREYVTTYKLVQEIGNVKGKKIILISCFNWLINILSYLINPLNKAFGNYIYKKNVYFENKYQIVDFKESIHRSQGVKDE